MSDDVKVITFVICFFHMLKFCRRLFSLYAENKNGLYPILTDAYFIIHELSVLFALFSELIKLNVLTNIFII